MPRQYPPEFRQRALRMLGHQRTNAWPIDTGRQVSAP